MSSIFLQPVSGDPVAPPDRRALAVWTQRRLYEGIFAGEFPASTPMVEHDLCERLGVSRQPVREALRQLEHDGLIEAAKGNGQRVVVAFGRENLEELYSVRAALEAVSFSNAATRISAPELDVLEGIQEELEARAGKQLTTTYDPTLDFRFHEVVCLATGMRTLHAHLTTVWIQTWALLTQLALAGTYPNKAEMRSSYEDRRTLIAALRSSDSKQAAAAVLAHIEHRRTQLLQAIDDGRGEFQLDSGKGMPQAVGVFL